MTLKIIIVVNTILILSSLALSIVKFKNDKEIFNKILMLNISFVFQTILVAGLILKQNAEGIAIVGEIAYLTYFIFKINKNSRVLTNK